MRGYHRSGVEESCSSTYAKLTSGLETINQLIIHPEKTKVLRSFNEDPPREQGVALGMGILKGKGKEEK